MSADTGRQDQDRSGNATSEGGSGAAGAARLRDRIDRGASGDKVAFKDPAAAPLGTDDEAAGTPPTAAQVSTAMQQEAYRSEKADRKPGPADVQGARSRPPGWLIVAGVLGLAVLVIAAIAV